MDWFWRAAVACLAGALAYLVLQGVGRACAAMIYGWNLRDAILVTVYTSLFLMPFLFISVAVYTWITREYGSEGMPRKTRCRKCGYILRGISDPRCPECGEPI